MTMKSLYFWLLIFSGWLFLAFNVEQISPAVQLTPFVNLLVIISALATILLLALVDIPLGVPFILILPLYVIFKSNFGGLLIRENLPLIVIEITLLAGTVLVTGRMMQRFKAIAHSMETLLLGHLAEGVEPFKRGQGQIYREIRRARHYQRPATLLAISVAEANLEQSFERFLAELEQEMLKKYIRARVADWLVEELRDYDVVAQRDHHFVALLPETGQDNIEAVIARLRHTGAEKLGLDIQIGFATFPDEAVTFETLLACAEAAVADSLKSVSASPELPLETQAVRGPAGAKATWPPSLRKRQKAANEVGAD
jgi:GGDEF domain-containing protein